MSEKGVCTLCGHILKNPKYLNHHMKTVHGNPKYFCEVCPYKCTSNTNLKRHINLKHNKDKEIKEEANTFEQDKLVSTILE